MRYVCLGQVEQPCGFSSDSEHACWEHAQERNHEQFADYDALPAEGALFEVYEPLLDLDVHMYCEPGDECSGWFTNAFQM
mgnify:CR=1 FL=1